MSNPGYLLVLAHSINPEKMVDYSKALPSVYDKYGGKYIGMGGPGRGADLLEGDWLDHSLVLARFSSVDAVKQFWYSPEYESIKPLRKEGGQFNVFCLAGNGNKVPAGSPAFLISIYRVSNSSAFKELSEMEAETLLASGVEILREAGGEDVDRLEGQLMNYDFSIAVFPSLTAAQDFWDDPSFARIREKRSQFAKFNVFSMLGLPNEGY